MAKANGWVKIHRKILVTELTASQFKFFVGAILLAKTLNSPNPGLVDLSVRQLASELRMSRSEVWRREKELEEMEMLNLSDKGFTINNYEYYQTGKGVSPTGQLRDTGTTCWICGQPEILPPMKDYSAWLAARFQEHHIIPTSKDGTEEPDNKVQLCQLCHKQAHHHQLDVKRALSVASQKRLELLQSKTVPHTGQSLIESVPPTGLKVPPEGLKVPPTGLSVPPRESKTDNKKEKNIKKIKKENVTNNFNLFWQAYPRKVAKVDAEKTFNKINPDEQLLNIILAAIKKAGKSEGWLKESGKFIPHPTTWLNGRRWEDEVVSTGSGQGRKLGEDKWPKHL